jgi:hypothetical protein
LTTCGAGRCCVRGSTNSGDGRSYRRSRRSHAERAACTRRRRNDHNDIVGRTRHE